MKKRDSYINAPTHITTGSVFYDLGFSKAESAAFEMKARLLIAVQKIVEKRGYTQRELEKLFDEPQPRISELLNGKISKMSIEKLLGYLERLGGMAQMKVTFKAGKKSIPRRAAA